MRPVKSNDRANKIESLALLYRALWVEAIRRVTPLVRTILKILLFSAAFYFAYVYGMLFHHINSAPFWAPDAVLLCALLLTPRRKWWLYLLTPLPIRFLVAVPPDVPAWFLPAVYINDSLKAIISAALLKRLNHGTPQLTSMQELVRFFAVAVLGVPMLSAFWGAAARFAIGNDFWAAWQQWFLGNALANLLLTPMILYWINGGLSAVRSAGVKRLIEGILLLAALILIGFKAFSGAVSGHGNSPVLIYLPFPLLLYAAVRFGPRGISSALSLITAFAIWSAALGRGPFSAQAPGGDIMTLQLFLCVISVPLLCLAVLLQERQRVGNALRESEERYRSVVESQTDLICRYLPDTTLTFVNDAYCRYFRKTQEELIGAKFLDFIPEPAREVTRKYIESLVESPRVEMDEHKVSLPDGSVGWQQWVDHAIVDANGKVVEFQAVGRDITERKQVEGERRVGEERLRLALEAGRMGVWEWDTRTNSVKWSREHYTVMGLAPFSAEPDYYSWADRVHPDDLPMATEAMNRAIEEKREYRAEYRIIWPDGSTRWVEGRGKPIYDEGGQCLKVNGLIVDISERKEAEGALRRSEEALRKSYARIEDLAGRLIAAQEDERRHIARELHDDLNQQVAALAIGISRLKRQFPNDDVIVQELVARLRDKTELLSERIRQVSHELHSSVLQHVGLPAALNSYCAEFSDREGIAVAVDIHDGLGALPSDTALCLYRVAQESLRNVARHSGARSAVVTLAGVNGSVELRVADQGVGFDPGQAREFRGLGLVSMEERVKLLRGNLIVTTRPGAGTELRAQIPLRSEHEQTKSVAG
jgi:PAS domain S-box-containing protein